MTLILVQSIPLFIFLGSLLVPLAFILWTKQKRKGKRNPLTVQMLRNPGESIAQRIEELDEKANSYMVFASTVPLMIFSMYMSVRYIAEAKTSPLLFVVMAAGFLFYFAFRLNQTIIRRHKEQLGLDCERAVGQELNQLMLDGYRVYHDFPADNFNIDHIVIGSNGVFAVETKGRAKPIKGEVKIIFDGEGLKFPTGYDKGPVNQAKRQADWLSKWLSSAVGSPVAVRPVLAFPGWFIERKKPGLLIYNGKKPQTVYRVQSETSLSDEMIQRICHQIEQKCRDVEGAAYKK